MPRTAACFRLKSCERLKLLSFPIAHSLAILVQATSTPSCRFGFAVCVSLWFCGGLGGGLVLVFAFPLPPPLRWPAPNSFSALSLGQLGLSFRISWFPAPLPLREGCDCRVARVCVFVVALGGVLWVGGCLLVVGWVCWGVVSRPVPGHPAAVVALF